MTTSPHDETATTGPKRSVEPPDDLGPPRLTTHRLPVRKGFPTSEFSLPQDVTLTEYRRAVEYLESVLFDQTESPDA